MQLTNAIIADLFNLLIDYVYAARAAPPVRAMLYSLIARVATLAIDRPNLSLPLEKVDPLLAEAKHLHEKDAQRMDGGVDEPVSSYFHALVELMTVVRLALGASELQVPWTTAALTRTTADGGAGAGADAGAGAGADTALLSMPVPIKRGDSVLSVESWPPWLDLTCAVTEIIRVMSAPRVCGVGSGAGGGGGGDDGRSSALVVNNRLRASATTRVLWNSLLATVVREARGEAAEAAARLLVVANIDAPSDYEAVESVLVLLHESELIAHRGAQGVHIVCGRDPSRGDGAKKITRHAVVELTERCTTRHAAMLRSHARVQLPGATVAPWSAARAALDAALGAAPSAGTQDTVGDGDPCALALLAYIVTQLHVRAQSLRGDSAAAEDGARMRVRAALSAAPSGAEDGAASKEGTSPSAADAATGARRDDARLLVAAWDALSAAGHDHTLLEVRYAVLPRAEAAAHASQALLCWSPGQNFKVAHCINELCIACGVDCATDVAPSLLGTVEMNLVELHEPVKSARLRMRIVQLLNREVKKVLRYINLARGDAVDSEVEIAVDAAESVAAPASPSAPLGASPDPRTVLEIVSRGRSLVLTTVKKVLLDSALTHTASRGADARKPDVKILSSGARLGTADTVFEQALRALRGVPVRRLRAPRPDDRRKQMFPGLSVSFEDEDAVGDDGPYLQLFSTISDEIADVEVR